MPSVSGGRGGILKHGDLSVLSFHATKVFNTFEGGAIVCPNLKTKLRIDQLKNFGHVGELTVVAPGINGKMSEFNAALGLLQLQHFDEALVQRKAIDAEYRKRLNGIKGIRCLRKPSEKVPNYAYFPILVEGDYPLTRDGLNQALKDQKIHSRRYFYPLISDFPMYRGLSSAHRENLPVATAVTQKILCLPIYPGLGIETIQEVVRLIAAGR
jgi:dTDP-4-amino-4,6-dideoxygalactose transaminase